MFVQESHCLHFLSVKEGDVQPASFLGSSMPFVWGIGVEGKNVHLAFVWACLKADLCDSHHLQDTPGLVLPVTLPIASSCSTQVRVTLHSQRTLLTITLLHIAFYLCLIYPATCSRCQGSEITGPAPKSMEENAKLPLNS